MNKRWMYLLVPLTVLACVLPFGVVTPPPPSAELMQTLIAATANSARLQTAAVLPTATFTFTPTRIPTGTLMATQTALGPLDIPALYTSTPTVDFVAYWQTRTASAADAQAATKRVGAGTPLPTPGEWTCRVLETYPAKGSVMERGEEFTANWLILNSGWRTWPSNSVDIVFKSGFRNSGKARQDIYFTVPPGGTITIAVPMTAPKSSGAHTSIWQLRVGRTTFCQMKAVIEVR